MRHIAQWHDVVKQYPCEVCGAAPGDECLTSGGRVSHTPHAWRSRAASKNNWQYPPEPDPPGRGDGRER